MIRSARVNDIVHSFVFFCRHEVWPCVMFEGDQVIPGGIRAFVPGEKIPPAFVLAAYGLSKNYIVASRALILLAPWLREFNQAERDHAVGILVRYYGHRIGDFEWCYVPRYYG